MIRNHPTAALFNIVLVVILGLSWSGFPIPAQAEAIDSTLITVTTTSEGTIGDGFCSLREAVRAANLDTTIDVCLAGSGVDIISLSPGVYQLSTAGSGEDEALTGDLDISNSVMIVGAGVGSTVIDGLQLDRIFDVIGTTNLRLNNLTLQNGSAIYGGLYGGGAIRNRSGATISLDHVALLDNQTDNTGGAIDNAVAATAILNMVTLDGNTASTGGAIYNAGSLVIQNSTFSNNASTYYGGGLDNSSNVTMINVTFSANSSGEGGGMFNDGNNVGLYNITFKDNSTAIHNMSELRIKNSIVANSTSGINCVNGEYGVITSQGHNLDSANTCVFTGVGDLHDIDPLLGPLADNQGPTLTHALLNNSPAIDAGDTGVDCPSIDQRNAMRPADGDGDMNALCDIGSYEYGAAFPFLAFLPMVGK